MNNKEIAVDFLKNCATGNVKFAYDKYTASNFKHHNQYFKGDRESLMNAMIEADKTHPNKSYESIFAVEENDRVVVYSKVAKENMLIAVFHAFKFQNNKIVEMWDVGQAIDPNCPNENGLF